MKIYVDADASPIVDIAIDIAKEHSLDIIIVKNYAHKIENEYAEIVSVDISKDSADFYIVNRIDSGDIVITQDYGLAALCLSKNAIVLHQDGFLYTQDNIQGMLNTRHIHSELRRQGEYHGKAKKRKPYENDNFEKLLLDIIKTNFTK